MKKIYLAAMIVSTFTASAMAFQLPGRPTPPAASTTRITNPVVVANGGNGGAGGSALAGGARDRKSVV